MKRLGMKPVWNGFISLDVKFTNLAFNILVKILASQLIREIGLQFFKRDRSPFFGSSLTRISCQDEGIFAVAKAWLNT